MMRPRLGARVARGLVEVYSLARADADMMELDVRNGARTRSDVDEIECALDYLFRLIDWYEEKNGKAGH